MLEQALTTDCCGDIIAMLLKRRGWTIQRIARVIGPARGICAAIQSGSRVSSSSDVEALAKA